MKCSKCGAKLSDDTKFCSYCGHKIEATTPPPVAEGSGISPIPNNEPERVASMKTDATKTLTDKIKEKAYSKWRGLSAYDRVATVSISVFVFLFLVALLSGKNATVVIAVIQIALAVVSILMHKGIIKLEPKKLWLKWLILLIAILFTVLNVMIYSWRTKKPTSVQNPSSTEQITEDLAEQIDWENITLSNILPKPQSNIMEILYNGEDWLNVTIHNISENKYLEYVRWCKEDYGFTIDNDSFDSYFYAQNPAGYCVTLLYDKTSKELSINLDAPIVDKTENPALPTDDSQKDSEAVVPASTIDYSIDYADAQSFEQALNDGVKVNGKIVQFDVIEYRPDSTLGINCWSGEHLNFISEEELDVGKGNTIVGRITEEPSKTLGSWKIPYEVLSIGGERIESELTEPANPEEQSGTQRPEITMTMNEDDFIGMNYKEAERIFREMGFTSFEYKTVNAETESVEDTIYYIEITECFIGNSDFVKGNKFDADSTVTFFSYKYEAPVAPSPVFYSTNDYETAKDGDSGVFSYRDRSSSYDIYWIIDLDEGYVFRFTDGNGDTICDRLKIDSGTLNDTITITYHDNGDTWSYKLHFKYVDHPETLIMVDQNGFDWEYSTTDLNDALSLRETKTIKDY